MKNISQSRPGKINGMYGTHRVGKSNPFYGKKHTEDAKEKNRKAHLGKKQSKESIEKMKQKLKGRKPIWLIGKSLSKEQKDKISLASKGRKFSNEHRIKISIAHKKLVKQGKHHLGDGSKTPINNLIRQSVEYKLWREAIFKRDNFTCVWCGIKGGRLNADHIKPFALYPELRFAIDNGRTLCEPCHKTTETYLNLYKKKK